MTQQKTTVDVTVEMSRPKRGFRPLQADTGQADTGQADSLQNYVLQNQIGVGLGGAVYRGVRTADNQVVELRRLVDDSDLFKRVRLAALVNSPIKRSILSYELSGGSPFVVLDWADGKPLRLINRPTDINEALNLALSLARLLVSSHELSLPLGCLKLDDVRVDSTGRLMVDLLANDFRPTDIAVESVLRRALQPTFEQDVQDLVRIIAWLICGDEQANGLAIASAIRAGIFRADRKFEGSDLLTRLEGLVSLPQSSLVAPAQDLCEILDRVVASVSATGNVVNSSQVTHVMVRRQIAEEGQQCGRYLLLKELGRGGMGTVFQAQDVADGTLAAVKVLNPETQRDATAILRFRREARVMGEIVSPFVAQLLDVNVWQGVHFLAMEYVSGKNLADVLKHHQRLPEPLALRLIADVSKGLAEAHARGIVHRDIKPGNIILQGSDLNALPSSNDSSAEAWQVKLVDFGLARRMAQAESMLVTRTDVFVGTPAYMAPEQSQGGDTVDARADIYALGCTLYEMLCGKPPFESSDLMALVFQHAYETYPDLRKRVPELSENVTRIVDKCLAKKPEGRFSDAGELAREIDRLLCGDPMGVAVHPVLPPHQPRRIVNCDWRLELNASPQALWPYVSNTERLNRAAGLPPVRYTTTNDPKRGVQRFAEVKVFGQRIRWQEHPFEWVEGRRMAVLREFQQGPFEWFLSRLELTPRPNGGTTLHHQVQIVPRNLLGRVIAYLEIETKARKSFERAYHHIDATLIQQRQSSSLADAFEDPNALRRARRQVLDARIQALIAERVDLDVAGRLRDFLALAPPQQVARIRPLALAQKLGLPPDEIVAACLKGVGCGLFLLNWDILCPSCRIASDIRSTLAAIQQHSHCEACNLDFEVDWSRSVELVFQVHPEIRAADVRTYCIGGPQHFPHVVAQVRLQPSERLELELDLMPGEYLVRGPQLVRATRLVTDHSRGSIRSEIAVPQPRDLEHMELKAGQHWLKLVNTSDQELLIRVEKSAPRQDAFTAAQASSLALFRELFPTEVLAEGQLATVAHLAYLYAYFGDVHDLIMRKGDAQAYTTLRSWSKRVAQLVRDNHGTTAVEDSGGVLAVFHEQVKAVQAALQIANSDESGDVQPSVTVGVSSGPSLAVTRAGCIEYFGRNVECAQILAQRGSRRDLLIAQNVGTHPGVAQILGDRKLVVEVVPMRELPERIALRVRATS